MPGDGRGFGVEREEQPSETTRDEINIRILRWSMAKKMEISPRPRELCLKLDKLEKIGLNCSKLWHKFDKIAVKWDKIVEKFDKIAVKCDKIAEKCDKIAEKCDKIAANCDKNCSKMWQNCSKM